MKQAEKVLARKLRKKGQAITTIAKQLNVAKSSVHAWTKDIALTDLQRKGLINYKGAMLASAVMVENYRKKREVWFNEGRALAETDQKFRLLCALYWGEGSKSRNAFVITNSDVSMIKAVHAYIQEVSSEFSPILNVRAYINPGFTKKDILSKWKVVDVPIKLVILKSKKRYENVHNKLYYGVGSYVIGNTELVQKVLGGIEYLREVGVVG